MWPVPAFGVTRPELLIRRKMRRVRQQPPLHGVRASLGSSIVTRPWFFGVRSRRPTACVSRMPNSRNLRSGKEDRLCAVIPSRRVWSTGSPGTASGSLANNSCVHGGTQCQRHHKGHGLVGVEEGGTRPSPSRGGQTPRRAVAPSRRERSGKVAEARWGHGAQCGQGRAATRSSFCTESSSDCAQFGRRRAVGLRTCAARQLAPQSAVEAGCALLSPASHGCAAPAPPG